MTEARLIEDDHGGRLPATDGWFVVNARETAWVDGDFGASCVFESREARFPELGVNLNVLQPGQPMTLYHREDAQEDFLVLAVGARHGSDDEGLVYPADPVAQRHGAAVETETSDGDEAYAGYAHEHVRYQEGWLPEEE